VLRLFVRRSNDVTYFTNDAARELDTLREDGPGWWLRGSGDTRDPGDVARVFTTTSRSSVVGYDIVVAAPRPISILVALDPKQAPGVIEAHRTSVRATLAYLEDRALLVRDRTQGRDEDVPASWQRIVSFTHGLNRHGEPHLHDHVLVGARPRGEAGVLDARSLYAHVTTADSLYRSSLRHELRERTSWVAWRSYKGIDHVDGLDEGYRALWGGHHEGRGEKLDWRRGETLERWQADLNRFEPEGIVRAPRRTQDQLDEHAFASAFEGHVDVTRRHVVSAWANAATFGQSPADLALTIDRLYPELRDSRGVREKNITVSRARMISAVRERGARPLRVADLSTWAQRERERERSGTWSERSR
jgi:hypothetical protein